MLGKGMGDNARFMALYTQMKEHFKAIEVKEVEKKKMMEAADNSLVGVEGIEVGGATYWHLRSTLAMG